MTQLFMTLPDVAVVGQQEPPAGMTVRLATARDAAALAELFSAATGDRWDTDRIHREVLDDEAVVATHVLVDGGGRGIVRGTASERIVPAYPGAGYLHWVVVDPGFAGQRLGALLTRVAVRGLHARGLTRAVLETDDFRVPAVVTYLRLGFVPSIRAPQEEAAWSRLLPTLFGGRG